MWDAAVGAVFYALGVVREDAAAFVAQGVQGAIAEHAVEARAFIHGMAGKELAFPV